MVIVTRGAGICISSRRLVPRCLPCDWGPSKYWGGTANCLLWCTSRSPHSSPLFSPLGERTFTSEGGGGPHDRGPNRPNDSIRVTCKVN